MNSGDALLSGLASGDAAPGGEPAAGGGLKREHDSTDDFEHLVGEPSAPRAATQSFLDMERELLPAAPARAPAPDQLADKFTDSESDDTAGESPLHRPAPPARDPTPVLTPAPAPPPPAAPHEVRQSEPVSQSESEPARPPHTEPAVAPLPSPPLRPSAPPPAAPAPASVPPPAAPAPASAPPAPASAPAAAPPAPAPATPPAVAAAAAPVAHVIEAEVIFCQMGLDAWFDPQRLHPQVESLIYWREPARSGGALGAGLALLVALACCSVVSVGAYGALLALSAAVAFRVYRNVLQAVQKTNEGHPFKWMLEQDISVPAERAQSLAAAATAHLNAALSELRRLFLVEDLVDSLKFGVLLWCLTYVGACFNGITLIILGWIALFTLPKAYEMNKAQVDANLELARAKINDITAKVRAAVPLGRKSESDKDK